jgi:hypothetical protein
MYYMFNISLLTTIIDTIIIGTILSTIYIIYSIQQTMDSANNISKINPPNTKSIIKTTSINNISSMVNNSSESHFKFSTNSYNLPPNSIEYIYINEIITNTHKPTNKCSNPKCRNIFHKNKCIYSAFDVQFCSEHCRTITSNHVLPYWVSEK